MTDMTPGRNQRIWTWGGELSGAVADLGITLPLAYALVVANGYPAERIFFLWGLAYVASGLFFRLPVSIQPLKAMAVIAIAQGMDLAILGTAAWAYGVLFVVLAWSGAITHIQGWFTPALVRGIQLGIGLMLGRKAVALFLENPLMFGRDDPRPLAGLLLGAAVILALWLGKRIVSRPVCFVLPVAIGVGAWLGGGESLPAAGRLLQWTPPTWSLLLDAMMLLMLPQLPLTLGNAVIAADDTCHRCWPERSDRVSVKRLAGSIGLTNIVLGLLGGFPVCHGAGGIAAHARFGGRTGRTTVILGLALVVVAIVPGGPGLLFLIPLPVLAAMLLMVSWSLIRLAADLATPHEKVVAVAVGLVGLLTRNLALALAVGWLLQFGLTQARVARQKGTSS